MDNLTALMNRATQGDRAAQDELFRATESELRKLALHWIRRYSVRDKVRTMDVMDRAFVRLMRIASRDWKHRGQFYAFACRSMMGIVYDLLRPRRLPSADDGVDQVPAPQSNLTVHSLMTLQKALEDLGRELSEEHRVIMELRFLGDCTLDEVAQLLDMNRDKVFRKSNVALAYLREKLAGSFPALVKAPNEEKED